MTLSAGTRLGSYEILSPLGAGGMGEVYRGRDSKLQRDVAIKVLPQSLAADPDALARFEREALAVAALSHPNILSIHDFGTHDGTSYAVMELLEGETLRGKLVSGPIPQKQAVDWALQIARGLSAAHEKGIVHRDLKPENLFVSKDGHVKILDFGLAKKIETTTPDEQTSAPTGSGHTEVGAVMGTAGYMSPEQVKGLPVDHRSDIFSFGAILYEMLSGKKAFRRDSSAETMAAIMRDEPPELLQSGRNISPALDHIVKHCLEKDRDLRFQTARDVAFNLSEQSSSSVANGASSAYAPAQPSGKSKVLIAVAAVTFLAAVGVFLLRRPHRVAADARGVKRVAVLPFENLGAPEDDYFADGIADEIRGKLTSLPGFQVIARGSSTPYRKTTKSPSQIAQELGVGYLLTATVRWEKNGGASRVLVSPELTEVSGSGTPTSKWQQPFDAALTDVFQVQSDIASRVAQALGIALGASEVRRLSEKPTDNFAAYEALLKGDEAANKENRFRKVSGENEALGFYEQAVALDPNSATAWAVLSRECSFLYDESAPTADHLAARAKQAADKAVKLAPDRPDGYDALGNYELNVSGDAQRGLEHYAHGLSLSPGNADLLMGTGVAESFLGRWEDAVEHLEQAEHLDPRDIQKPLQLSYPLLNLRRYREAREACDRGLSLRPAYVDLLTTKIMSFVGEGDASAARSVLVGAPKEAESDLVASVSDSGLSWLLDESQRDLLLRLTPSAFDDQVSDWALSLVGAYASRGDAANVKAYAEMARKAAELQLQSSPESEYLHVSLGLALAYLGQSADAIREGERAVAHPPKRAASTPGLKDALARIYILVGEQEKALDQLESLMTIPYRLSAAWLRIDPTFASLRKNPRFQKLVASGN